MQPFRLLHGAPLVAGAHLAALLAAEKPPGLRAAVLVGGPYDLPALATLQAWAGAPSPE